MVDDFGGTTAAHSRPHDRRRRERHPTGPTGCFVSIPFNATPASWRLLGDQSGSLVIDVWSDAYGNFPPTVADTIAGTEKPTLSAAQANEDTSLTTWTPTITAGDVWTFNVDSCSGVTRATLTVTITPS